MKVTYFDRQDAANPMNGTTIVEADELAKIFGAINGTRKPYLAELVGDNGFKLLVGIAAEMGCVQFSARDGSPPYLMAIGSNPDESGHVDFLMGGTATPIPKRYCLPTQRVRQIAASFLQIGERARCVEWEEI
jgi:hypothetical protein